LKQEETNVLLLSMGQDNGGVLSGIKRGFAEEAGWSVHTMVSTVNYIEYEVDIPWHESRIHRWWKWADVIHLQNRMTAAELLMGGWHGFRLPAKPFVVTFHGTDFRSEPTWHLEQMHSFGALGLVSTLDLYLLAPDDVTWMPNPTSVEMMQERRARKEVPQSEASEDVRSPETTRAEQGKRRPHQQRQAPQEAPMIRIAHAPTNREIKSTEALRHAVQRLWDEGYEIELDLIERETWDTCLDRKAQADIYFDQVILGYGNNAIECWGMGIPVIAGAAPATLTEMERRFGQLPFYRATEDTIYDALKALIDSPDLRAEYGERGLEHVRRFHDEQVVVEQLKDIYWRAAGMQRERVA
jgi:hypothetical protein